jgi:hypothetical protein
MRFARKHTHNGVTHQPGDPFTGTVNTGRFLYHRGVLEADGGPDAHFITRNPSRRHAWGLPEAAPAPEDELSTAWNSGETQE